jgi:Arc/MetJ-type ribon-helix-helix transcriptional regulator
VEIEMDWPHSEEYEVVRDGLRQQHGEWQKEKKALQQQIDELKNSMQKKQQLQADHDELLAIKGSRSYRITRKIAGILKQ